MEEAKAAMQADAQRDVPHSPLTIAKFDRALDLYAQLRQLVSLLVAVHTKLFPNDRKISEVEAMVETGSATMEAYRERLHPN